MREKILKTEFIVQLLVKGRWEDDILVKPFPRKAGADAHIVWQKSIWEKAREGHPARPAGYRVMERVTVIREKIVWEER